MADNRALAQVASDRPSVMTQAAEQAEADCGFFGTVQTLISRAQAAGALRADFRLEDVPAIHVLSGAAGASGPSRSLRLR